MLDGYRVNGDGADTPVDPRMQRFVRNVLADLTQPAAPARVAVRRLPRSTRIALAWSDRRITSATVFRHRGAADFQPDDPGVVQVCRTTVQVCNDRGRLSPGLYRYAAIALDEWGTSAPRLSLPVRVRQPKPAKTRSKKA